MLEEFLKQRGLKYEDLNAVEKETYAKMAESLGASQITPERLKDYISQMKYSVEEQLTNEPEYIQMFIFKVRNDKNIFLKARLKNYLLLEAFLNSPDRAKKMIESTLKK